MHRRRFIRNSSLALLGAYATPQALLAAVRYPYHGRIADYKPHQIIEPGLKVVKLETFVTGGIGVVRVTTDNGKIGMGQMSTYDADISAMVLHKKLAKFVLGKDPADIDHIVDNCIERNLKYPWSFVCRALAGIDTALWDLYGKLLDKPVYELLGAKHGPFPIYGSSMSRQIKPKDEAERLLSLREKHGYRAFKFRIGRRNGHNQDAWPGRTEAIVPTVRKALGDKTTLLVDANSCYTPDKAIEVAKLLADNNIAQLEEPCPYWELEWTKKVTDTIKTPVSGGEQDNDLAQWRRMIKMRAVDILQPDICYIGGLTRALRVAQMAAEYNMPVIPHSANLSMVTIFSLHMMKAIPNAGDYVEFSIETKGIRKQADLLYTPHLKVADGKARLSAEPGWGVNINDDWLKSAAYQVSEFKS